MRSLSKVSPRNMYNGLDEFLFTPIIIFLLETSENIKRRRFDCIEGILSSVVYDYD